MARDLAELRRQGRLDWLTAAILIARDANPQLDADAIRREFDALARPLSANLLAGMPPAEQARALTEYLGNRLGFQGNEADYEDPNNSLIDRVLERKVGIPISLALIYVEVARRVGVDAVGVGFPGHFLVRINDQHPVADVDRGVMLDPFMGDVLVDTDLELLAERVTGSPDVDADWLRPAEVGQIVLRMLANLREAYARSGDNRRLLVVLHRMCELELNAAALLRDRGLLQAQLGAPRAALSDLESYLENTPQASDAQQIQELIDELSERVRSPGSARLLN
jgi:regulator of sirC expression with transglutaminase-like and TPR domain